jgi:hypothetical protein
MKKGAIIAIVVLLSGFITYLSFNWRGFKSPAPMGIHGTYSLDSTTFFTTAQTKDSMLFHFQNRGWNIKPGRLNEYDPPWDSLRYLVGNIKCDTTNIEGYIEFTKESTTRFFVLWINAPPSDDDAVYEKLSHKYFDCLEDQLESLEVTRVIDAKQGNH